MVGWLFLLERNGHHDPFIDQLRWSAILFPAHYCISCWLMKIRSGSLPRQICFWTVTTGLLALFTYYYVTLVIRFVNGQWVS